ncbi:hypothetical protein GCM10027440_03650 [Nocardiopsis coralliicola]
MAVLGLLGDGGGEATVGLGGITEDHGAGCSSTAYAVRAPAVVLRLATVTVAPAPYQSGVQVGLKEGRP